MRLPIVICLSFCFAICATDSHAATLDVLDKQRQTAPEPRSKPKLRVTQGTDSPEYDKSAKLTLGSLHVENATVFSSDELTVPYQKLYGTAVSFDQMMRVADEMTKKYREAGYLLSRVVLVPQEVDAGQAHIRLVAVEGRLTDIEYAGDPALAEKFKAYFQRAEGKLVTPRPLQHKVFEREMLLAQDLPGIKVESHFKPGQEAGSSILVIDVERDIFDFSISGGNTGTESSGPFLGTVSAGLNTLPAIGSRISLSYTQADKTHEYYAIQTNYSHQFATGLIISASYAYSSSPKQNTEFARLFDYETRSNTVNLGLSYPVIRSRDMNLSLNAGYEHRNSRSMLLNERYTTDRLRNLSFGANFDIADEWGGVTQIIPTFTKGLDAFHASDRNDDSSSPLAGAEFFKFNLYASRNQQLPKNFSLFASAELQLADSSLASYNKYSLGGMQFGRGYDSGDLEGDNAFACALEGRWTHYATDTVAVQPFAFVDWGSVWSSRDMVLQKDQEHLSSVGLGVRLYGKIDHKYMPDFNVTAFVGKPLKQDNRGHTAERFVIQASLSF